MANTKDNSIYPVYGVSDVTISGYTYKVESFSANYPANEILGTDGNGMPYSQSMVKGEATASMSIGLNSDSSVIPAQFAEFSYTHDNTIGSQTWVIKDVSPKKTKGAQTTVDLSLTLKALVQA